MTTRQIPQRDVLALKQASHDLVEAAGGVAKAAAATQATVSRLSEACSPWHDNRFLTLIQIADLECVTGQPIVSRVLAGLSGQGLTPLEAPRPKSMAEHFAAVVIEFADVQRALAQGLQDGALDATERHNLDHECNQLMEVIHGLQAELRAPVKLVGAK